MSLKRTGRFLLLFVAAGIAGAGCNRTAAPDPFAREEDPNVQLQGLAMVVAGAMGELGMALNNATDRLSGDSPEYLNWARTLADPDARPDALREAMLGLTRYDYGRKPPYTDAYAQFARQSPHALVRAAAVRALNISRAAGAGPLFVERLEDEDPAVRLEAAKALANLPAEGAAAPLLRIAQDPREELDVRIAAIDALKHDDSPETRRALVSLLEAADFSLAWQARRSLVTATGQDRRYNVDAWRRALG